MSYKPTKPVFWSQWQCSKAVIVNAIAYVARHCHHFTVQLFWLRTEWYRLAPNWMQICKCQQMYTTDWNTLWEVLRKQQRNFNMFPYQVHAIHQLPLHSAELWKYEPLDIAPCLLLRWVKVPSFEHVTLSDYSHSVTSMEFTDDTYDTPLHFV
jgi:hypothetical protein